MVLLMTTMGRLRSILSNDITGDVEKSLWQLSVAQILGMWNLNMGDS